VTGLVRYRGAVTRGPPITGETDLGPFEAWVDLAPGVEVTVPLGE